MDGKDEPPSAFTYSGAPGPANSQTQFGGVYGTSFGAPTTAPYGQQTDPYGAPTGAPATGPMPPAYSSVYPPTQQPTGSNMAVVAQPSLLLVNPFGPYPARVKCHFCNEDVTTVVNYRVDWLLICLLFLCIGILALFCLCVNSMKEAVHTCPNCKRELGRFSQTRRSKRF